MPYAIPGLNAGGVVTADLSPHDRETLTLIEMAAAGANINLHHVAGRVEAVMVARDNAEALLQERNEDWSRCYGQLTEWRARGEVAEAKVARLLAAVHNEHYDVDGQCASCRDWSDNPADWPCPTVAAVDAEGVTQ